VVTYHLRHVLGISPSEGGIEEQGTRKRTEKQQDQQVVLSYDVVLGVIELRVQMYDDNISPSTKS
jgi:hypothetical protein